MFPSGPCKGDANHTARELSQHVTIRRLQHCRSPLLSVSLHISFKAKYCQYADFFHICQTCNAFFHLKAIFLGFCWVCHFLRILSGFFGLTITCCDHYVITCFHATLSMDLPTTCYMFNISPPPRKKTHTNDS